MKKYIILLFLFLNIKGKCTNCECYKIDYSLYQLEQEEIEKLKQDRVNSCEYKEKIVDNDNCKIECDCCLENKCFLWNDFSCVIFRLFELFRILYFILFTLNLFLIFHIYFYMFYLKYENKETYKKKVFYPINVKYEGNFLITLNENQIRINDYQKNFFILDKLIKEINKNKNLGQKNLIQFSFLIIINFSTFMIHVFFMFTIKNKPIWYTKVSWISHFFLLCFYTLYYIIKFKLNPYRIKMNLTIKKFQNKNKCKIVLNKRKKNLILFINKES